MDYDELMAFAALAPRRPAHDPIRLTWWQWEWLRALVPAGVAGSSSVWGVPVELIEDVEESTPVVEGWRWRGGVPGDTLTSETAMLHMGISATEATAAVRRFRESIKEAEEE